MTTKPKRKAAADKIAKPKATPGTELDLPGSAIVEAQDILAEASKLTDAINLMALELNEYECGAIFSVAHAMDARVLGMPRKLLRPREIESIF